MMFSGHTSIGLIVSLFLHFFFSENQVLVVFGWILGISGGIINVIVGDHYSVDVLVATYLTFFVFYYWCSDMIVRENLKTVQKEHKNEKRKLKEKEVTR